MEPVRPDAEVALREVTAETVRDVCRLAVRPDQARFVAANAFSIAQAHFDRHAWFRAVYAGETPVGFVMLRDDPADPEVYLWRFMIDARYQRLGFGRRALEQVVARARARPARAIRLSYVPGEGSPRDFYAGLGFADTDEWEDDERVMRLALG